MRGQLARGKFRHAGQPEFGNGIAEIVRIGGGQLGIEEIHHQPALSGRQKIGHRLGQQGRGQQVYRHLPLPQGRIDGAQPVFLEQRGIVHQHADRGCQLRKNQIADIRQGQIRHQHHRFGRARGGDFLSKRFGLGLRIIAVDGHAKAIGRQRSNQIRADPAGAARNQCQRGLAIMCMKLCRK